MKITSKAEEEACWQVCILVLSAKERSRTKRARKEQAISAAGGRGGGVCGLTVSDCPQHMYNNMYGMCLMQVMWQ